ncbi:MAG: N-6 DNA methylase [Archangium sp.]|nr:N-6 DNA methylase [Archangium sp.]
MSKQDAPPPKVRRQILENLGRERLSALTLEHGLKVDDRRVLDQHVDALVRAPALDFPQLLAQLKREELQAICEALDLDRSGKEKSVLVARILGLGGVRTEAAAPPAAKTATGRKAAGQEDAVELPVSGKLSVDQLERYLWSAADILRGSIDSSDYKGFIFGMLFLKRLSDVFEEEAEKLIAKGESSDVAWNDPDYHEFFVPKRARWSELVKLPTDIGNALNKACGALEEANAPLEGILGGIDFNDERKLGDAKNRDTVLGRLVQHFSKLSLKNANLAEPDMLGRAYEYLIEQFADDAGKKGGEFYTPTKVVQLLVELLTPSEGMRVCDPTCGSGGMLVQMAKYVERHGGSAKNLTLHGQEKNLGTWAICKMNMLLHGLSDARVEKGDTIRDPKLLRDGALLLYDRVIANPPFSLDEWGIEVAEKDGFGRFKYGLPPKTKGDLAFVQHMVATLNVKGQLAVVMPHGVLFRGGGEAEIRKGLLKEDLIEAVVGLPSNLFYGTGIPAAVLVINRAKPTDRLGQVLFIDASKGFEEAKAQRRLRQQDIVEIGATFRAFRAKERYARVVAVSEIEQHAGDLNISRYIETADVEATVDLVQSVKRLRLLEAERTAAEATMNRYLRELGYVG